MKKTLTTSLILFTCSMLFSQEIPKRFYLSGTAGISYKKADLSDLSSSLPSRGDTKSAFSFSPDLGYFFSEHMLLGVSLDISNSLVKTYILGGLYPAASYFMVHEGSASAGIYFQYFLPLAEKFFFSPRAGTSLGIRANKVESASESTSAVNMSYLSGGTAFLNLYLEPEFQYKISESLGVKLSFAGFDFYHGKDQEAITGDYTANEISFSLNPADWKFGVFVLF